MTQSLACGMIGIESIMTAWTAWSLIAAWSAMRICCSFLGKSRMLTARAVAAGGWFQPDGRFQYVVASSAKKGETAHGPMELRTGFLKAIIKYGKATNRSFRYLKADFFIQIS